MILRDDLQSVGMLGFRESFISKNEDESSNKPSGKREREREKLRDRGVGFFQMEWWVCLRTKDSRNICVVLKYHLVMFIVNKKIIF